MSTNNFDFTIVTHRDLPGGSADDILLANRLRARGKTIRFAVWDHQHVDWSVSRVTIVRSSWDYHRQPSRWFEWLGRAGKMTRLVNQPGLLQWNTDKKYLLELAASGVNCVPTEIVENDRTKLAEIIKNRGWMDFVVKPSIAASASGAKRFATEQIAEGQFHLFGLLDAGGVIVQPYLEEVETLRERSLVFIGGKFQHAFSKPAFSSNAVGETDIKPHVPSAGEKLLGRAALSAIPFETAYARVDMVPTQDGPTLMELELIEPDLGLRLFPHSADILADYLLKTEHDDLSSTYHLDGLQ